MPYTRACPWLSQTDDHEEGSPNTARRMPISRTRGGALVETLDSTGAAPEQLHQPAPAMLRVSFIMAFIWR